VIYHYDVDTDEFKLEAVHFTGNEPEPKSYPSAVLIKSKIFIFGGLSKYFLY
jgi:hypothetical protein